MKRYEKYKPSGIDWIGEIPMDWNVKRMKWIAKFEYGNSLAVDDRREGEVPVYGSNGITGTHDSAISKAPCIIIGRKGSFGKVNWSEVNCYPIDTTYFIDETKTRHNLRWLYYLLPNLGMDLMSRDTGVPGLNREDAYQKTLPVPGTKEQTAIANYLDKKTTRIDELIAKKEKLIEALKEERTAIINEEVSGKGKNWGKKKLKFLAELISKGTTPSTVGAEIVAEGKVRFLKAENILTSNYLSTNPRNFIDEKTNQILRRSELKEKDVLIVIAGATIGKVAILEKELLPANTNQAVCFIRLSNKELANWVWLNLQMVLKPMRIF